MGNRVSAGVGLFNDDGSLLIEPTGRIRVAAGGAATFAFIPSNPGIDQLAQIDDATAAASAAWALDGVRRVVSLGPGTFDVSAAPSVPSGVELAGQGEGVTVLRPHATFVDGGPDDWENCLLRVSGTLDPARLTARLTSAITPGGVPYYGEGARAVSLDDVGSLAAGDWFATHGWETGDGMSPGGTNGNQIIVDEILRADSVAGLVVTLAYPTTQHHVTVDGPGASGDQLLVVRAVDPIVAASVRDLTLDAAGRVVADGLLAQYAVGLRVNRVEARGFTRMAVELREGSRDARVDALYLVGCNGGLAFVSANTSAVSRLRTSPVGPRFREVGSIRGALWLSQLAVEISVDDYDLRHGCIGMWLAAFRRVAIGDGTIADMDATEVAARDGHTGGVGIHMGVAILAQTAYCEGLTLGHVRMSDIRCPPDPPLPPSFFSVYFHDVQGIAGGIIEIDNDGLSPYTTIDGDNDYFMPGVGFQDAAGSVDVLRVRGCENGFVWRSSQGFTVGKLSILSVPGGGGTNPVVGMYFDSVENATLRVRQLELQGGVYFGPLFDPAPAPGVDNIVDLRDVILDSIDDAFDRLVVGINASGLPLPVGSVVVADPAAPAGAIEVLQPSADAQLRQFVVAMPVLTPAVVGGPVFLAPPGTSMGAVLVDGVAAVGDKLVTTAGATHAHVDNTAPQDTVIGVVLTRKTAAGVGLVSVGPR